MSYLYVERIAKAVEKLHKALKKESKKGDSPMREKLREETLEASLLLESAKAARSVLLNDDDILQIAKAAQPEPAVKPAIIKEAPKKPAQKKDKVKAKAKPKSKGKK